MHSPTMVKTPNGHIFSINIVPGILLILLLRWSLDDELAKYELLKGADWLGIFTMTVGLSALQVVLEEGNRKDWFSSSMIQTLSVVAFSCLTAFVITELKVAKPFINLRLLSTTNFCLGNIANLVIGMALYGSGYLVPLYLAQVQGYGPEQIGRVMMWQGLPQLVVLLVMPKVMQIFDLRYIIMTGLLLYSTGLFLTSFMSPNFGGEQLSYCLAIRAIGLPMVFVTLSAVATSELNEGDVASGSALFNMMKNLGGSIGTALIATFLTRREQLHSSNIGEAISIYSPATQERLNYLVSYMHSRGADHVTAKAQALRILEQTVWRQSFIVAFNDCFFILGIAVLASALLVFAFRKPADSASLHITH